MNKSKKNKRHSNKETKEKSENKINVNEENTVINENENKGIVENNNEKNCEEKIIDSNEKFENIEKDKYGEQDIQIEDIPIEKVEKEEPEQPKNKQSSQDIDENNPSQNVSSKTIDKEDEKKSQVSSKGSKKIKIIKRPKKKTENSEIEIAPKKESSNEEINLQKNEANYESNIEKTNFINIRENTTTVDNEPSQQENIPTNLESKENEPQPSTKAFEEEFQTRENKQLLSYDSDSTPRSLNDFFSGSRHDNAKRIQTQIAEMENNAIDYCNLLIKLARDFDRVKNKLSSSTNSIFNFLFSLLGYSYSSNIQKPNLFVFACQAWFIELGYLLKSRNANLNESIKFCDILQYIKENELSNGDNIGRESNFLNNLGILTGNLLINIEKTHTSSTTLIENNIGKIFLQSISHLITNDQYLNLICEINKRTFDEILTSYFKRAIERTLNTELETLDDNYIEFYQIYEDLYRTRENYTISPSYDDFFAKIKSRYSMADNLNKKFNSFESNEIKMCIETFYDFSQIHIDDILYDIKLFIKNYSSILYKTRRLIQQSYNKYLSLSRRLQTKCANMLNNTNNLIGKEKIKSFSTGLRNYALKNMAKVLKNGESGIVCIKNWVGESVNNINNNFYFYFNKLPRFKNLQVLYNAGLNYTFHTSEIILKYVVDKYEVGHKKYSEIKHKLSFIIYGSLNSAKSYVQDKIYNLITLHDENGRFTILINKKLVLIDPDRYRKIFNFIIEISHIPTNFINNTKNNLLKRYKYFFKNSNESQIS